MSRLLALRARVRFALWVTELRIQMRRHGGRLVLEGRARFDGPPHISVTPQGSGDAVLTLRFADGVRLGRDLNLEVWALGTNVLEIGAGVYFQHAVRVQLRGGTIALGEHSHVRDGALLRSEGELRVGEEVTIGAHDTLNCVERVDIDDRAGIGERVTITDSDHRHDGSDFHFLRNPLRVTPVRVGRNVLVSANVVIMRGARIGDNSVIAAGAVVGMGEHPPAHVLGGVPARVLKPIAKPGTTA